MDYLMIVLRLIHIVAGVFWVGAGLMLFYYVTPAILQGGEAGQKIMGILMGQTRLTSILSAAAGSTVLAGFILYWIDSDGFTSAWLGTGPGIGFGLGAVFGLLAFIFGMLVGRTNQAMAALGRSIQGQPTSEQASQLAALRSRSATLGPLNAWSLILAAALMAIARYLSF